MVRMEYGYSQIIQIMALYVPHIKKILISLQGIETQEGNPVFLKFMSGGTGLIPTAH